MVTNHSLPHSWRIPLALLSSVSQVTCAKRRNMNDNDFHLQILCCFFKFCSRIKPIQLISVYHWVGALILDRCQVISSLLWSNSSIVSFSLFGFSCLSESTTQEWEKAGIASLRQVCGAGGVGTPNQECVSWQRQEQHLIRNNGKDTKNPNGCPAHASTQLSVSLESCSNWLTHCVPGSTIFGLPLAESELRKLKLI